MFQLSLTTFRDRIMVESVVLMINNSTMVANIKKQGDTISRVMCDLAQEILSWVEQFMVVLTTQYTPEKKNVLTNQLSRLDQLLPTEWSFLPLVFGIIGREYVHPFINSLPQEQMQNCPSMCLQFLIPWLGQRIPSCTVDMIAVLMFNLFSLF